MQIVTALEGNNNIIDPEFSQYIKTQESIKAATKIAEKLQAAGLTNDANVIGGGGIHVEGLTKPRIEQKRGGIC